jgi:hypothetical protein
MATLSIALGCLLVVPVATNSVPVPPASGPTGAAILARLADADRRNRAIAVQFLFQEDIVRRSVKGSVETTLGRKTFEVSFLESENYYRLIAENGAPLPIDDEMAEQQRFLRVAEYRKKTPLEQRRKMAAKDERNRLKFDLELLSTTHTATVIGPASFAGRETTIVDISPAGKLRKPKNRNRWGQILAGRLWIDNATGYPVRAEMKQLIEWDLQPAGNSTVFEWNLHEGAWLISFIENTEPLIGGGTLITRQSYSNYSRFQAESRVTFTNTP